MFNEMRQKLGTISKRDWDDFFVVLVIILVSCAAFGLGRLSASSERKDELQVVYPGTQSAAAVSSGASIRESQRYVASISGTKYHLLSCPGAQAIKEENKLYFATKEEAEAAGYSPAANCPGL